MCRPAAGECANSGKKFSTICLPRSEIFDDLYAEFVGIRTAPKVERGGLFCFRLARYRFCFRTYTKGARCGKFTSRTVAVTQQYTHTPRGKNASISRWSGSDYLKFCDTVCVCGCAFLSPSVSGRVDRIRTDRISFGSFWNAAPEQFVKIFWIHEVNRTGKLDAEVGGGGSRRGISPPTHLGNINVSFPLGNSIPFLQRYQRYFSESRFSNEIHSTRSTLSNVISNVYIFKKDCETNSLADTIDLFSSFLNYFLNV